MSAALVHGAPPSPAAAAVPAAVPALAPAVQVELTERAAPARVSRSAVRVARRVARRAPAPRAGMERVVRYARAQVGKRYVPGADGPNSFDCSGFTKAAYAQGGMQLPHSSRAQAARARNVPQSRARAGDLVVGPGHVGLFMRPGWMIDAGNRRVGVTYRRIYRGLHVETFARRR